MYKNDNGEPANRLPFPAKRIVMDLASNPDNTGLALGTVVVDANGDVTVAFRVADGMSDSMTKLACGANALAKALIDSLTSAPPSDSVN